MIEWLRSLFTDDTVVCEHSEHELIGHNTLREEDLFYKVYDRPIDENDSYWCENDGVYIKLRMYEHKYICRACGMEITGTTGELAGGEDGIIRKADGRPDETVEAGAYRMGWSWYEDNEEKIEAKYHA